MRERDRTLVWKSTLVAFLCLAIWPLWASRFPPLQDYPEQLFYTEVLRAHGDPAFDYDRYYEFRFHPVYATFYLTTLVFAKFVPIEIAGKLSLSLYPVLIALLVARLARRFRGAFLPWGALLFFPLAFNQQYFFGNIDYMLSLPIVILALLDFEDLMGGDFGAWPIVRNSLWQIALFVTHPLTFLVYVSMAFVGAILTRRRSSRWWGKLGATAGVAGLLLLAFWLDNRAAPSSAVSSASTVRWLTPLMTMEFFLFMFNGMRPLSRPDFVALGLWVGVSVIALRTLVVEWRSRGIFPLPTRYLVFLALGTVGVFALPFQVGDFSYINVRIAAVFYFLAALLIAHVSFRGWWAGCLVGLLGLCMVHSAAQQARIAAETEEILPIVRRIPPHSRILPLVFDRDSAEMDFRWFDMHIHDHSYYHILVGGGFNPYLLGSPIHPVRTRAGQTRPAPDIFRPDRFSWEAHAADYQYFLIRGAPDVVAEYMAARCNKVLVSGRWMLFERELR